MGKITKIGLYNMYFFVTGYMFETGLKNMFNMLFTIECASGIKYSNMKGKIQLWYQGL